MFQAHRQTYLSFESLDDQDNAVDITIEFLNSLNPSGLPPYKLNFKIGTPIILLRNLNASKLCNGTRLRTIDDIICSLIKKFLFDVTILFIALNDHSNSE